jgi:hypothetical protein
LYEAGKTLPVLDGSDNYSSQRNSYYVESGSFTRLKNLQVGYSVDNATLKKLGLGRCRFYVQGQNLLTFSKYTGLDPDVTVTNITEHALRNSLSNSVENVNVLAVHGAIYTKDEYVFFPKVNVANDNGAQITQAALKKDYRGLDLDYEKIPGYSLNTLSTNYSQIDFLHMDVQGAEAMLLNDNDFIGTLNQKVATFFIATQSRLIEGIALEKLSELGWFLIRERPTMYRQNNRTKDINGWTLRDGGQLWINPKFGNYLSDF